MVEFNRVPPLVIVEAHCRACAPVEFGLCDESVDDHTWKNTSHLFYRILWKNTRHFLVDTLCTVSFAFFLQLRC